MIILFELNDKVSKIDEKISGIENKDKKIRKQKSPEKIFRACLQRIPE